MNARETVTWAAVWSGIFAVTGVAAGILMVGSPPTTPVVHSQPVAVVRALDTPADTTTDDPAPTTTPEQPVTTTDAPTPTDTAVDTPPPATPTTTDVVITTTDDNPRNPPMGAPPIVHPEPTINTSSVVDPE